MSTFKVKLTPLTPINFSPEPSLPVHSKQDIIPKTTPTATPRPDLSASLDWRFDELPNQFPDHLSISEELNMMFPPDLPVFGAQFPRTEYPFPGFELGDYALIEPFCPEEHPFSLSLPQELAAELWGLTQNMGSSLFSKSEFIPDAQENRFVDSGFEEFAAFGIDVDELPQT